MSYLVQSDLAEDAYLTRRIAACAATQRITNPEAWAREHRWELSSQPGWVDAYKYAIDSGDEEPGANEGAVTDGMILSAVQLLAGIVPVEPEPEAEPENDEEE